MIAPTTDTGPFDAVGHLLAEMRRLDLILWIHAQSTGRPTGAGLSPPPDGADPRALLEQHAGHLRRSVDAALRAGVRLPLLELCRHFELDPISLGVLMLALAPHLDRQYERVYASLQGDPASTSPRLDLALQVFGATPAERLSLRGLLQPGSPLLRSGFLRLIDAPGESSHYDLSRVVWVSPRVLRFLTDQPGAEPEVEAVRVGEDLPPPTSSLLDAMARFASVWTPEQRPGAIALLRSEDPLAALSAASVVGAQQGIPVLAVDLSRPATPRPSIERVIEAVIDEARLLRALVAVAGLDDLDERTREAAMSALIAQLTRFDGACVLVAREAPDLRHELGRRPVLVLDAPLPDAAERASLWAVHLAGRPDTLPRLPGLAQAFRLGSCEIRDAARMIATLDVAEGPSPANLRVASQAQSRHGLGQLAQRVPPWGAWEDLVLPPSSIRRLRSIVEFLRQRDTVFGTWGLGRKVASWGGATAMFTGPPGTGKTLSASLIAQAIGIELFRIDLAGVVSKYIGETEKNLDRVFRAACRSNAVLFFDEADALFGKRTEVKDAHDRYANVETSYLLQKLEAFDGLAILATNLKRNIDAAFMRRIDVQVEFPFPDPPARLKLWTTLMPREMPRDPGIDLEFLAERFELSGGHIKNVIQAAAVSAAAVGAAVGMRHLMLAVRWELQKQGKLAPSSSFGPYAHLTAEPADEGETTAHAVEVSRAPARPDAEHPVVRSRRTRVGR